jgi:glycosyltransferase involved in cell wall biosynthesis
MKPRILYAAFDVVPRPKGASTHITYFARGLVEAGYDLTLITAGDESLPEQDTYVGATMLRAPANHDANYLARGLAFGDYVLNHVTQADPYHIIHFRSIWSGFPLARTRAQFGHKLLYEVNGLPSVEMKYHYPALRNGTTLRKFAEREMATLHLADTIICPSHVTRAYIASQNIPEYKITVIPNGVDTTLFRPREQLTARSDSQPDTLTILYTGTFADWQGLDTLIMAMPTVLAQHPVRLRLVGRGRKRQRKALAKRIRKLELGHHVTIEEALPYEAMPALISQANVCVAPLGYNDRNVTQGCCPLKILEYMACGCPVVASNLPVTRELVCPDVDALLFEPDNAGELAQKIMMIVNDRALACRLGTNATTRASQQFGWETAQKQLLAVYRALLKE